jgi:uncharacterized delta-60 repeat protein
MRSLFVVLLVVFLSLLLITCGPSKHRPIDVYLTVESDYGSPIPPVGSNYFNYGMTITASVTPPFSGLPGTRYVCTGWTGTGSVPASGSTNSVTFLITENSSITWNWQTQYQMTINVLPVDSGTIECIPEGPWYDADTSVQLTAIANEGYGFTNWSGDLSGTENPKSLAIDGVKSVTANFVLTPVANFMAGPRSSVEAPLTVQFTNASTSLITSSAWDFDNNGTIDSTEWNPSYTYNNMGVYTVRLTVTGPGGSDEEVKVDYISVGVWAKSYGGAGGDWAYSIQRTSDGGYIVVGETGSFGAGYADLWALKLNSDGAVSWQKAYGGIDWDEATSIQQTRDSGYIVAGWTGSFGTGDYDFWVLKLNSDGTTSWQKRYGGTWDDSPFSIHQTGDGGYIMAGGTYSFGTGNADFWVLKLSSDGTVAWQKRYGGAGDDCARSIQQTRDGGYIVAATTYSFGAGGCDFWVLKLNSSGTVAWQKTYGGTGSDWVYSIQQTSDGGYIVAGETSSFGAGYSDFWVIKLNSTGAISWQKRYGGTGDDYAYSIQQTSDGGYVVAGETRSFGAGDWDFWVLKLNGNGTVAWQKTYGGTGVDWATSMQQTSDGGYIVAGYTESFGAGYAHFWVLKLGSDGIIAFNPASGAQMTDTNAVPVDTNCTLVDTTATVADTSATVTDTNAAVTDTNATIEQQAP